MPKFYGSGYLKIKDIKLVGIVFYTYVICGSQFVVAMSKLAELVKRAGLVLDVVLAELGLILLFQGVDLSLVAIEAIIV